jgi:iron(III) transport system substrate-binding protein
LALTLASCGGGGSDKNDTLTIYNGQHEELVTQLTEAFTKETGIEVDVRSGDDADLASQIREEGEKTKADVLLTEEPGPAAMLDKAGLLAPVDKQTLADVDPRLVPSSGDWTPYAARSRVLIYNPKMISENELPKSVLELTDPRWKGKFAYAPSGAFAATTAYLVATIGEQKTLAWLKGIRANGVNEQKNGKVRDTVEAGQHAFGLTNHYYWWVLAKEQGGQDNLTSRLHYFTHPDAGGLVLASAAAITKNASHPADAQRFLSWLTSSDGGQKIIATDPSAQYPVAKGVVSGVGLAPLAQLESPRFDSSEFADMEQAKALMIKAGLV